MELFFCWIKRLLSLKRRLSSLFRKPIGVFLNSSATFYSKTVVDLMDNVLKLLNIVNSV